MTPFMRRIRVPLLAAGLFLALASPAVAGDPIMPLAQVHKGMDCKARTVVQGTEIVTFDVEIIDVVAGDPGADSPRILFSASGPAVDRTGLGPGFSGSPIYCRDDEGAERVAGAISESIGEYGGKVALATPIELVIGEPVDPPAGTRSDAAMLRRARTMAAPLSISGLSPKVGRLFARAAARANRVLYAAPARPRAHAVPPQELRPGSAMAVGLASGDISAGAVGTVAYVDDDRVWSFGHPLDGAGRRALFLQDAYVFTVINNPVGIEGVSTYKLAAPGHDVGLLSGDGHNAVVGRVGAQPDSFPLKIIATDEDTGRQRVVTVRIADENAVDLPTGTSSLALAGSSAVAQAVSSALGGAPARQTGSMCARITVSERPKPMRFCNRYLTRVGGGDVETGLGAAVPMVGDFLDAVTRIDEYNFARLHITGVEINAKVRRGLRQAFMLKARAPQTVRRGRRIKVRVQIHEIRGTKRWITIPVRVPRRMPRGERELTLTGTPSDDGGVFEIDLADLLFGEEEEGESIDEAGPRSVKALAASIARISRYDGVVTGFEPPGGGDFDEFEEPLGRERVAQRERETYRDPELRLSGELRIPVRVR